MKKSYFVLPLISALTFVSVFELSSSPSMAGPAKDGAATQFEERLQHFPREQVIIGELAALKDNYHEIFRCNLMPGAREIGLVFFPGYSFYTPNEGISLKGAVFMDEIYDRFSVPALTYRFNLEKSDPKAHDFLRGRYGDAVFYPYAAVNPNIVEIVLDKQGFADLKGQAGMDIALTEVRVPVSFNSYALGGRYSLNQAVDLVAAKPVHK